jgi:ketosteroid isomerase-like protein
MHPVGGRQLGWASVRDTWAQVGKAMSDGQVGLSDQLIRVAGDMAYEVGREQGFAVLGGQRIPLDHRVTNVYRHEAKGWRIVHHHTDASGGMQAALNRLKAGE